MFYKFSFLLQIAHTKCNMMSAFIFAYRASSTLIATIHKIDLTLDDFMMMEELTCNDWLMKIIMQAKGILNQRKRVWCLLSF
jgi:hypothetical protein